mmetsp:Transcript_10301/g.32498  ORF Transcript_10301/g.32498 Transcript_10301/m.32498 type:complete len:281 (-) Transcript_10301:2-844(-)
MPWSQASTNSLAIMRPHSLTSSSFLGSGRATAPCFMSFESRISSDNSSNTLVSRLTRTGTTRMFLSANWLAEILMERRRSVMPSSLVVPKMAKFCLAWFCSTEMGAERRMALPSLSTPATTLTFSLSSAFFVAALRAFRRSATWISSSVGPCGLGLKKLVTDLKKFSVAMASSSNFFRSGPPARRATAPAPGRCADAKPCRGAAAEGPLADRAPTQPKANGGDASRRAAVAASAASQSLRPEQLRATGNGAMARPPLWRLALRWGRAQLEPPESKQPRQP